MNHKLHDLIEIEANALGFDLVRVAMIGGKTDPTLQIMAERPDTRQLTIADCEALSRRVSERLDALEAAGEDPIDDAYRLEVSSPGIDRPLTRLKDYSDWQGHEARLKLSREVDGAKQVTGDILGVEEETISISGSQGDRRIPFDAIHSAKLLLTDRLIAATQPLTTEGADELEPQEEE
ncbi:ribosome maturation protein RimP [Sphingomonas glaciei]|uniref:Ribosome maturation factor RimP n=1 Tax=Sphingomonas glaciei TaxID=2938948 RepID=A0ABY5MWK4_9SPHN|nr:ribosome maturation protein RimP [Sphingomonas glaciei]UUR08186.1 ribosome maturation protein RimP [Sphingomonas glaciei]